MGGEGGTKVLVFVLFYTLLSPDPTSGIALGMFVVEA